ncbi:glycoside hydrolase superfamily [Aspergillus heterothallicus]
MAGLKKDPPISNRSLSKPLQDVVTYDKDSFFINGERLFVFSGEYAPFRHPSPDTWLDAFQKIKALGFNTVSFYVPWFLVEGKAGNFKADGVFNLKQLFKAASDSGLYLIARPGPYIHTETSGGGLPGWMQRVKGLLRTTAPDYLAATNNYMSRVCEIIAEAQITNGGPVILVQAENEYSEFDGEVSGPDGKYMQYVIDQIRNAGITVPITSNDAHNNGLNAPGTGTGGVDVYGYDQYPIGVGCWNLDNWVAGQLNDSYWATHLRFSPDTPHLIAEFQAGTASGWNDPSYSYCAQANNEVFARVIFKNLYASGVKSLNLYSVAGGTNWGNLGYPDFYTSYDLGAMIAEDGTITREKYSETKLQAQFFKVSPAYYSARPVKADTTSFTNSSALRVTQLLDEHSKTSLYVIRHNAYESRESSLYQLKLFTSRGNTTVPSLRGALTLNGRDSKIHVSDYQVGSKKLLYSSAEIFTWKKYDKKTVLVLYGGPGETHEAAIISRSKPRVIEGPNVLSKTSGGVVVFNWQTSANRTVLQIGDLQVYLLDRNAAYNYFVPLLPSRSRGQYGTSEANPDAVIIKAGYLVRNARISGSTLQLSADFNSTTEVEVIGAPARVKKLEINGQLTRTTQTKAGGLKTLVQYEAPQINLPDLEKSAWKHHNALPEIQPDYDDSKWIKADHLETNNTFVSVDTPTVLFAGDYGFHPGYLLYRGHFVSSGNETNFNITTSGGAAFGSSVWLNSTYLGSWHGDVWTKSRSVVYDLPSVEAGKPYVITVVIDNNGYEMNFAVGVDSMKSPRGVLNFSLDETNIDWKLTGNFGGEDYQDHVRGPRNEGGSFPERQGWHQPSPPSSEWEDRAPTTGLTGPGISFFTTDIELNIPSGWDIPLSVSFNRDTTPPLHYRVQLFVNGWQFGKFNSNLGPQTEFPVPEGILNYRGKNTIALTLWSLEGEGTQVALDGISLKAGTPVRTSRPEVKLVDSPKWTERKDVY